MAYKNPISILNGDINIKPIYTIVGGVNGSGKSSLSGALKKHSDDLGIIIDVDKLTSDLNLSLIDGGKSAIALINDCLSKKINFTQETTLSGYSIEKTIIKAKKIGYFIRLYYVGLCTPEECLERISNRVKRGGHNINSDDVLRRFNNRFDSLFRILSYCDEVIFFDNDNGFMAVAEYKNGKIITIVDNQPLWVIEMKDSYKNYIKSLK